MNLINYIDLLLDWCEGIWGLATVIFWSVTYIFIVVAGFYGKKERQVSMPYVAGVLNVAWEIAAIHYTKGNPGFILWLLLDLFIVSFGFRFLSSVKKKILYCISILLATVVLRYSFTYYVNGFLFTVYFLDVIMAMDYFLSCKRISQKFKVTIAAIKLLGDIFAGLTFWHLHRSIRIMAVISFVCNLMYLAQCIKNRIDLKRKQYVV